MEVGGGRVRGAAAPFAMLRTPVCGCQCSCTARGLSCTGSPARWLTSGSVRSIIVADGRRGRIREETTMEVCEADFDNRFTQQFGMPAERIQKKISDFLPELIKAYIAESPFLVMATSDSEGRCDASPKGGKPGFVRILDDRHLLVPDVSGNKLFQSYQNMDANAHVGLMFLIPGISEVVRVNGKATIVSREDVDEYGAAEAMPNPD